MGQLGLVSCLFLPLGLSYLMPSLKMAPQVGWTVNLPLLAHLSVLPNLGTYNVHTYVNKRFLAQYLTGLLQNFKEIKDFFSYADFWHFSPLIED